MNRSRTSSSSRQCSRRAAVTVLCGLLAAACSTNRVAYPYRIVGPLNPNIATGTENLLQLKSFLMPEESVSMFDNAQWPDLAGAEGSGDYGKVSPVRVLAVPQSDGQRRGEIVAGEKDERTRFLGVIANFNQKTDAGWRTRIALDELAGRVLLLQGHQLTFVTSAEAEQKQP